MDYEKKYKEALSLAKKMQENSNGTILNESITITDVFPELKESEDKRIRKALIELVKQSSEIISKSNQDGMLTWLEKQADKEKDKRYEYLEELIVADDIYQMSMNEEMIINAKSKVIDTLDKLHLLELLGIEKENEKKSIDSVEHKFNVGDWLVSIYNSNDLLHIIGVDDKDYEVETTYGNTGVPSIAYVDSHFRHWTINDAKDGDILVVERDKTPFIFKGFDKFHPECPVAYCGIDDSGIFVDSGDGWWTDEEVYPATKEQRDTLFTKMKEASYEFDFEKKELNKKIEQKSVDKIELKFKVGDWIVTDKNDKVQIKAVNNEYYTIDNGMYFNIPYVDKYCHLWTIEDAKDGDVLAVEPIEGYPSSFVTIYKKQNGEDFDSYCFVGFDGKFYKGENGHSTEEIHPATKEQCDQLEKAIADAGYKFDFEKKELEITDFSKHLKYSPDAPSIIEHKPTWSDEDEEMLGSIIIDVDYIGEFPDYPTKLDCELKDESNAKIKWLKSIKDRVQPQPKEWSDEDENMLVKIIEEGYLIPSERQWLKSLKNRVHP